ncbi:hypothetical protein EI94DRAFT_1803773 [Lactarius quietus]|nr:hypothetical protein EI94DRAFT_1803773 [Lactarius quietus]
MSQPARKIVPPARFTDNAGEVELTSLCRGMVSMSASVTTSSPLPASSPPPQTDTEDPTQSSLLLESLDSVIILLPTTSDEPDGTSNTTPQAKKTKTSLAPG